MKMVISYVCCVCILLVLKEFCTLLVSQKETKNVSLSPLYILYITL